ncbi:c-type cytochrome biogenesis protein CcmI [Pseudooceanicola marinus]|uniref:c-type cytochrome biogenesis protein CcmI n=1 Tax=Pseudooceanicola marinus TaxID=396013 RepID=UPI001CD51C7E|nr:c-type cytochrome biogenesis protein CcmI [Pseudooceanicola marinus]MCA1334854.1 c-type cytochrome biogenesis protein CcmI [Pseudooceanicola marinus]
MLFWTIATLISLAVAALLARRMFAGGPEGEPAEAYDVGIYRDQLAEVDRDLARGALPAEEADRVRTEVSRRLLAADAAARASGRAGTSGQGPRLAAAGLALAVTLGALWLYYDLGAPGYGDMPRAGRIADAQEMLRDLPAQAELEANATPLDMEPAQPSEEFVQLMEQLRSAVAERPDDPRGQRLLARNEAALGNFAAAARAQAELLRLSGPSASGQDYADYADMLILAAGGQISAEAGTALQQALRLDPRNGTASYYSGLMMARTGRPDIAFRLWDRLLSSSPADAPWVPLIRAQMPRVASLAGEDDYRLPPAAAPLAPLAGPSQEDIDNAAELSDEGRQEMVRGMVGRLSERLANEGGSAQEWARLISSLGVLGETAQATEIYAEAQQVFAADPEALQILAMAARSAGAAE